MTNDIDGAPRLEPIVRQVDAYGARCRLSGKWRYIHRDFDDVQGWVDLEMKIGNTNLEIVPLFSA